VQRKLLERLQPRDSHLLSKDRASYRCRGFGSLHARLGHLDGRPSLSVAVRVLLILGALSQTNNAGQPQSYFRLKRADFEESTRCVHP
jgi:hypothetical protein